MPAGGQCVYRGVSDCAGHTQHFHHGLQGIRHSSFIKVYDSTPYIRCVVCWSLHSPVSKDAAQLRPGSQPADEESFPGAFVLPADPSV